MQFKYNFHISTGARHFSALEFRKGWIPMPNLPDTMNPDVARKLLKVGDAFRIQGPFFSYEEIKMGNVNHTYKVNYIRDDGSAWPGSNRTWCSG